MTRAELTAQRFGRRLSSAGLAAGLCALLWSSPAFAAAVPRTSLSVGATVVETCQVSTRPDRSGAVTVSCTHDVPVTVAVELRGTVSTPRDTTSPGVSHSSDPDLAAGVIRVTVSY